MKKYIPPYDKDKDVFYALLEHRTNAIKNAKKLEEFHKKKKNELFTLESNPSTGVFRIVGDILKITEYVN